MNKQLLFRKTFKISLHIFLILLGSILLAILLKVFCFASFRVPSFSMEPTLTSGDYIMVNKLIYGPRVFKNWRFWFSDNLDMKRINGIRSVGRNEIFVFNCPYQDNDISIIQMDFNVHMVKRCVGIPGDTFYIEKGFYKVKGCNDTLGVFTNQFDYSSKPDSLSEVTHLFDKIHRWTKKDFGPFYIPKKNDNVQINEQNIEMYGKLISYETGKSIEIEKGRILLDGKLLKRYIFTMNYYFMAGDYVFDSFDSRYWGLLPEDHIIGKVAFIWKSQDEGSGKYRWKRFFKDPAP